MKKYILVVEDDLDIQELIYEFLSTQGYQVDVANDGLEGIQKFKSSAYDLVILDIMLPNMNGYQVCQMIRHKSNVPIIMITALGEEEDQIKGFDLGVDDYITKPFSFQILIKRVEAVLRRNDHTNSSRKLQCEDIVVDCDAYTVYVKGEEKDLTGKEFEILAALMEEKGKVLARETLLDKVWGYDYYGDSRVVDVHIKNLRKKLDVPYIKTVKGVGYKID